MYLLHTPTDCGRTNCFFCSTYTVSYDRHCYLRSFRCLCVTEVDILGYGSSEEDHGSTRSSLIDGSDDSVAAIESASKLHLHDSDDIDVDDDDEDDVIDDL